MNIKTTEDYGLFVPIDGNRAVNQKKVEALVKDINEGLNLLPYAPIIVYRVDGDLKIVDGQHRFEACKILNHPVHYMECEKLSLKQIARINSRSDKWKQADFLQCYINIGLEDYVKLRDFMTEHKTTYAVSINLLMHGSATAGGSDGVRPMDQFRDGNFECRHLDFANELVKLTESVFGRYKFWNDKGLITAVQRIRDKGICDFETLRQKIKANPNLMEKATSWKDYAYMIEKVYNHHNSKRVAII